MAGFHRQDGKDERGGMDGQQYCVATFFRWDGRADRYLSISCGTVLQMGQQGGGKSALNRELVGGRGGRHKGGGTEQQGSAHGRCGGLAWQRSKDEVAEKDRRVAIQLKKELVGGKEQGRWPRTEVMHF